MLYGLFMSLVVVLDLCATRAILNDEFPEPRQKFFQLCIVWILPVVGALLLLGVHRKPEKPSGNYRQESDAGDDYGSSGANVRSIKEMLDGD